MLKIILVILLSYILGSIPFSYIISFFFKKIDITKNGTNNPGTSNVFLTIGPFAGVLTAIGDIGKGILAILLAKAFLMPDHIIIIAGIAAIVGHCFSIFLKFKGGKGQATTAGVMIILAPWASLIGAISLLIIMFTTKRLMYSMISAFTIAALLAPFFGISKTIFIGLLIIALSRWYFDTRNKDKLSKKQYEKLISKFQQ